MNTLYTKDNSSICAAVIIILLSNNIRFQEVNLDLLPEREKELADNGYCYADLPVFVRENGEYSKGLDILLKIKNII